MSFDGHRWNRQGFIITNYVAIAPVRDKRKLKETARFTTRKRRPDRLNLSKDKLRS